MPEMTVVWAGTYAEFCAWCLRNNRSVTDRNLRYVHRFNRDGIRGLGGGRLVRIGTWADCSSDTRNEIERELAIAGITDAPPGWTPEEEQAVVAELAQIAAALVAAGAQPA